MFSNPGSCLLDFSGNGNRGEPASLEEIGTGMCNPERMETTPEFIRQIPKAELHVHIEGTLEPELMFALARRNGLAVPYPDVDAVRAAYEFTDLQSFLDIYYQAVSVLVTREDFHDLMAAYLRRAIDDGVRRAEVFFDPQIHTERDVGFEVFMPGFLDAIHGVEDEISVGLIMCFVRHLPATHALATFESARPYLPSILGVGLDSSEVGFPPGPYADVYRLAAEAGLRRVAHAGEEGPPEYIREALDVLGAERIDHGVRATDDPALVDRLIAEQVPLTMCPLSNIKLRVFDRLTDHNLPGLLERGAVVSINSDDPAYFGGYIAENYFQAAVAWDLTKDQTIAIARNSILSSFAGEDQKAVWLAELDTLSG
jgi:adenosine deaminase